MEATRLLGYQYVYIAAICCILLFYIAATYKNISNLYTEDRFLFYTIICSAITALCDVGYGLYEFGLLDYSIINAYIITIVSNISSILCSCFWLLYSENKQRKNTSTSLLEQIFIISPFIFTLFLILTTPMTHLYFYFDQGTYYEGKFFIPVTVAIFIYSLYSGIRALILSFRKDYYSSRNELRLLFAYTLGLYIISSLVLTLPNIIPFRTAGNLVLFLIIIIQSMRHKIRIDPLCNINNRFALDHYLNYKFDYAEEIGLAVIDLDKFKFINDKYGHKTGDSCLKLVTSAIIKSVPRDFFVSRYGGDEFVVIGTNNLYLFDTMEDKINENLDKLITDSNYPFDARVSLGYACKSKVIDNIPDLIDAADKILYKRKDIKNVSR